MAHEKSPFLDSSSDENINLLTKGGDKGRLAIIHQATCGVCFTDHLPEHYNRGSANINLPV
jgi:hypothetical protein